MSLELNQTTFRRLVQLNLVGLLVWVPIFWIDLTSTTWTIFSEHFEELVTREFGEASLDGIPLALTILSFLGLLVWIIASSVGLLWFRRWARLGFWVSMGLAMLGMMLVDGNRPSYSTAIQDVVATIESMVAGAIVLMSYAKGYGAEWFAPGGNR